MTGGKVHRSSVFCYFFLPGLERVCVEDGTFGVFGQIYVWVMGLNSVL